MQAALLRVRLGWLGAFTDRRRDIADAYRNGVSNPLVKLLAPPEERQQHVYHLFVVRSERRNELADYLATQRIQNLIHYPLPIHQQPVTKRVRRDPAGLPNAERHARECLSIPCHPGLSDGDVERVVATINTFR